MEQLQSGDEVLAVDPATGELTYTTMYLDSHYSSSTRGHYLAITTAPSNATIMISPEHFMYRKVAKESSSDTVGVFTVANPWAFLSGARLVPVGGHSSEIIQAGKVRPGDVVFISKVGDEVSHLHTSLTASAPAASVVPETVTSVVSVVENGRHAPKTHTGNIIVDGVLAHCTTTGTPMVSVGKSSYANFVFALLPDSTVAWFGQSIGVFPILQWLHEAVPDWFEARVVAGSAAVGGYAELPFAKRWGVVAEGVYVAAVRQLRSIAGASLKPAGEVAHSSGMCVNAVSAKESATRAVLPMVASA
jgi:hypothetical protein